MSLALTFLSTGLGRAAAIGCKRVAGAIQDLKFQGMRVSISVACHA
ncbi:hypothetical protein ACETRX_35340 [Labrys portucalensis]|uniref:Uncharacterized protein n=1 Tax=Labrys neptuniae TaxID=376174 RepID=A0ABV6ZS06_9HYPH